LTNGVRPAIIGASDTTRDCSEDLG
jgi:hypothetical protein